MRILIIALRLYFLEAVNIVYMFLMLSSLRMSVYFKKRLASNEKRFSNIVKAHDQYLADKNNT